MNMPNHTMEYYWDHKAKGLCVWCDRKAVPGRTRCEYHRQQMSKFNATQCEKRHREGRCISCGWPMHDEMDRGHVKCVTCRMQAMRRRIPYENTRTVCSE